MRKKLYLFLTLKYSCLIKEYSNICKFVVNLIISISIQQMDESYVVSFLYLHWENFVFIWIFLISNDESINISIYTKWRWEAPFLFIFYIDYYQFFKEFVRPIKDSILFWIQYYLLLSNSIKLRYFQYFLTVVTYHISICYFNDLFEIFNIVLAKRLQATIASKGKSRIVSS